MNSPIHCPLVGDMVTFAALVPTGFALDFDREVLELLDRQLRAGGENSGFGVDFEQAKSIVLQTIVTAYFASEPTPNELEWGDSIGDQDPPFDEPF